MPAAYKRIITQKERKDDGIECFITPLVPFAERRIIVMKKKVLMLLMIITLSVSMTACGTNKEASKNQQESETDIIETETTEAEIIVTESETEETNEPESQAVEDTAESETDEDIDVVAALGTFDGEKYVNEQLHMTITLPTGWEVMSDEEKYEVLGFGADVMTDAGSISDEQAEQLLQNALPLFSATDSESITDGVYGNVNITAERLTGINKLLISSATDYLDISKQYFLEIEEMDGIPVKYELGDYENVTIGGIEWTLLPLVLDMNNGSIWYTQNIIVTRIDDYTVILVASYLNETQEARISELIGNISFE